MRYILAFLLAGWAGYLAFQTYGANLVLIFVLLVSALFIIREVFSK